MQSAASLLSCSGAAPRWRGRQARCPAGDVSDDDDDGGDKWCCALAAMTLAAKQCCCDSGGDVLVDVQRELHSQVAAGDCLVDAGDGVDGDGDNEPSALAAMMMAAQGVLDLGSSRSCRRGLQAAVAVALMDPRSAVTMACKAQLHC